MEHPSLHEDSGIGEDYSTPSLDSDRYDHEHISKLEVFSQDLQQAITKSFPRPTCQYTAVYVLLLRWTEDDLNVQDELTKLKSVFKYQFRYNTEQWDIPSLNPTRALQTKLYDFQDAHQSEDELLIVYYGGHGDADRRRGRSIWAANQRPDSPTLTWSSLQHLLENAVPPVLIILDCCFAANAARDTTEGTTKEILAACGRENPTLGVGIRSFTSALTEELVAFGQTPFTVAMLHSRLVTMRWRLAYTPIYALLSEHGGHSIELGPLPLPLPIEQDISMDSSDSVMSDQAADTSVPQPSLFSMPSQQSSLSATAADTRVLLAVSILGDAVPDISEWKNWLTSQAPWDVRKIDVKVEAVFESHSTLLLTSLPIFAWNTFPHKAAYHFIGFVKSPNLEQVYSDHGLAVKQSGRMADRYLSALGGGGSFMTDRQPVLSTPATSFHQSEVRETAVERAVQQAKNRLTARKGETRLPRRSVDDAVLIALGYPFKGIGPHVVVLKTLSQKKIDKVLNLSRLTCEQRNIDENARTNIDSSSIETGSLLSYRLQALNRPESNSTLFSGLSSLQADRQLSTRSADSGFEDGSDAHYGSNSDLGAVAYPYMISTWNDDETMEPPE